MRRTSIFSPMVSALELFHYINLTNLQVGHCELISRFHYEKKIRLIVIMFFNNFNFQEPHMIRKIATRYCEIYNNPSNEYIKRYISSHLQEKRCEIILIDLPTDKDSIKQNTMSQSTIYTIVFASIGFILFALAVGMVAFMFKRYRGMAIL